MSIKRQLVRYRVRPSDQAILFVHGFRGGAVRTWRQFARLLSEEKPLETWDLLSFGYHSLSLLPDLRGIWTANADLQTLADLISTSLRYHPLQAYRKLTIVAHSMGGLIVQRALLDDDQLCERTNSVFLFGTPSGGLWKAGWLSFWSAQCRDIENDSPFVHRLRSDWDTAFSRQVPFELNVIAGHADEFVPRSSSQDPFPDDVENLKKLVVSGDHLDIVKPADGRHMGYQIVVQSIAKHPLEPQWASLTRLAQLPPCAGKNGQLKVFRGLLTPDEAVIQNALLMDDAGFTDQAIQYLEEHANRQDTDAMGVLAGRYKRQWLSEGNEAHARRAFQLYQNALDEASKKDDLDQMYYHAINVAFMNLAYASDYPAAQRFGWRALKYCQQLQSGGQTNFWLLATIGEANLYLEHTEKAIAAYRQALQQGPRPRQRRSTYLHAARVADLLDNQPAARQLAEMFDVESDQRVLAEPSG